MCLNGRHWQPKQKFLLQGTIYPDCIESEGGIKSHHNVGGLPLNNGIYRSYRTTPELYKTRSREVAEALGLPKEIAHRMPFPGPGLSVRVVGKVTREAIEVVKRGKRNHRRCAG